MRDETLGTTAPTTPFFTVGITTYQRPIFLVEAIESVLAQTFTDYEVIIVDDASADNTADVVAQFAAPNVQYLRQPTNLGVGAARNEVIKRARGPFIAFLDDDDRFDPDFLRHIYGPLRDAPESVGFALTSRHILRLSKEGEVETEIRNFGYTEAVILPKNCNLANPIGGGTGLIVRVTTARAVGGFPTVQPVIEDREFMWELSMVSEMLLIPQAILLYNRFPGDRFTTNWQYLATAREQMVDKYRQVLSPYPKSRIRSYLSAARIYYGINKRADGRRCLWKIIQIAPFAYETWKLMLLLEFNKYLPKRLRRQSYGSYYERLPYA